MAQARYFVSLDRAQSPLGQTGTEYLALDMPAIGEDGTRKGVGVE